MKSVEEIRTENLRLLIKEKFGEARGNKTAFGKVMRWQPGLVSRYLAGKRIDKTLARRIERDNGYPENWLDNDHSRRMVEPVQLSLLHEVDASEHFYHLPLSQRFLQGGPGVDSIGASGPGGSIAFRRDYIDAIGLDVNALETWFVQGDSMEELLRPGDLVIVNTAVKDIVNGDIYAFYDQRGGGRIKCLHEQRDGSLTLRSENSRFPDENIPAAHRSEIEIVGVVELRSGRLRKSR